jgi:transcription elongation GreA/GreB family factor
MLSKAKILEDLFRQLNSRIEELRAAQILLRESRDNESKSSAGDKYETGRAMAQIELDKLQQQLQNQMELQAELLKIKPEVETEKVGFGSLVETSNGIYFISIGMGKVMLDDTSFYAISLASPLGQALKGAQTGDTLTFNRDNIQIISVI